MKSVIGPKKRARISSMCASFAQIVLGAGFVSYFFREGSWEIRIAAIAFFLISFIIAIVAEPEKEVE